jgi:hypothetical protein
MSLMPVGLPMVAGQLARRGALNEDEQTGLFDFLMAAAVVHLPQAPLPGGPDFQSVAGGGTSAAPVLQPAIQNAPLPESELLRVDVPTSETNPVHEAETMPRSHIKADDATTYTVQHGTLPVFVAGQLVELTLLRERRPSRQGDANRRLSMTLEAPASGSVKVDARVDGECLLVSFESAVAPQTATRESYAREVEALARRLGWTFTETRWEESR